MIVQYIFFILLIFFTFDLYFFSGYQECIMFSLILILTNFFFKFKSKLNNILILIPFLFFIYLLSWVKNEGIIYFFIFTILILHHLRCHKIFIVTCSVFLILFRYMILNEISNSDGSLFNLNFENYYNLLNISKIFSTIILVFKYLIISFFKNTVWLFIIAFFILSLFTNKNKFNIFYFITVLFLFFILSIYLNYYVVNNNALNNEWFISVTLSRLMYHISAFYILYIIYYINLFKKIKFI